jgi:hypothetical protein
VVEAQAAGVEEVAIQGGRGRVIEARAAGGPVEGIADDGMSKRGEVDADLMGAASVEPGLNQREVGGGLQGTVTGGGLAALESGRGDRGGGRGNVFLPGGG